MAESVEVSIVMCVYNGAKTVRASLESIFACRGVDYEVIAVDDGSTDDTLSILRQYPCRTVPLPKNRGIAFARNRGIEASRGKYLLFTDSDCIMGEDWVARALESFKRLKQADPRIAAVEGRILPLDSFFDKCDAYASFGYNQSPKPRYTEHFCTSNIMAERRQILDMGMFDEKVLAHEDSDMGLRLLERGHRLYYDPSFLVWHNHTRTGFWKFLKHEYDYGRFRGNYLDIRFKKFRWTPVTAWLNNIYFYASTIPFFALLITLKIVWKNLFHNPAVLLLAPFIFLSKVGYRLGALEFIRKGRLRQILGTSLNEAPLG